MKIKEIYTLLGQSIVDSINEDWNNAILEIEFTGKSSEFSLSYFRNNNEQIYSDYSAYTFELHKAIKELHKITTEEGIYTKWNKIDFKLTSDGQMELEYIWDQELYDEIESLSK